MPGPVSATRRLKCPSTAFAVTRTSPVSVNLMALPTRLSRTWVRRCSSPKANWKRLVHGRFERELLVLRKRLGGRAHGFHHALDRVLGHVLNWPDSIWGDVEHGVDEAQDVLAVAHCLRGPGGCRVRVR